MDAYEHYAHVFCIISHMNTAFCKEFQRLHAAPLINVRSKTVDQSEDAGGGASIASYYLQQKIGMATVLFDHNMAEKAFYSVLLSKPFLSAASRVFRCKDMLCVNGPLIMHTNDVIVELQWVMCWKQITFVATNTSQITGFFIPLLIPPIK